MKANYHTHTWRCNHASGAEKEYVDNALLRGLEILGFSDHTPYFFPGSYYSRFRMKPEQLADYVSCIQDLKKDYNQIQILTGLETEYYPCFFPELRAILKDYPVEYLILGQHFTNNEIDGVYSGSPTSDPKDLKTYCKQVIDGMQTGLFTYIAHPDLINFCGNELVYAEHMRQICRESKACNIPLEFNFLGLETGRNYPNHSFLRIVAEEGCAMVFGCDAHEPASLLNCKTEETARMILAEYGIPVLEEITIHSL